MRSRNGCFSPSMYARMASAPLLGHHERVKHTEFDPLFATCLTLNNVLCGLCNAASVQGVRCVID